MVFESAGVECRTAHVSGDESNERFRDMDVEIIYQFFSLIWTFVSAISNVLVCLPYFVLVNSRVFTVHSGSEKSSVGQDSTSWMYYAKVHHSRSKPVKHTFSYDVRVALINLDNPPKWYDGRANDTMTSCQARDVANTKGNVMLLTHPPVGGYRQNPISVYYCYNESNTKLEMCIAEVTNTPWGDRVTFLFRPDGEKVPKSLHVSPLMDMDNVWCLKTKDPGVGNGQTPGEIFLQVSVTHPIKGNYFCAVMKGELDRDQPHQPNESAGYRRLLKYGFQPQRIALWIYWHALVLLWKGVSFYPPPSLQTCQTANAKATHPRSNNGCPFIWRPAQEWPWATGQDAQK